MHFIKLFLIGMFFTFTLNSCEDEDSISPENSTQQKDTSSTNQATIEELYNITEPYFYTGVFNGSRITYQTDNGRNFAPQLSYQQTSSNGGNNGLTTGFFSHLSISIWHEHGFYNVPDTSDLMYINKPYTHASVTGGVSDTLHFRISYSVNNNNYTSQTIDSPVFEITNFYPLINRSGPKRDIYPRFRGRIDSVYLHGPDTILLTDFTIQALSNQ